MTDPLKSSVLSPRWLWPLLFGLTVLAFVPALSAGWMNWDDPGNFLENPNYRGLGAEQLGWMWSTPWMGHYQPLSWMSLGLDFTLWGMDARGYHATNVMLHALSALLFGRLLLDILPDVSGRSWGVAAGTLFFAVHPLRAESVAWITERRDVLAMVFFQATLLAYLRATRDSTRWLAAAVIFHLLSLSAKAHAITLPAVLLVLDAWPLRRLSRATAGRVLLEKVPFALAAGLFGALALRAQADAGALVSGAEQGLWSRLQTVLFGLSVYPGKVLVPLGLSPLYERVDLEGLSTLSSILMVAFVTLALGALGRRFPAGITAWLLYGILLAPVSGLAQSGPQLVADRYTYFSTLPFAVLFGAAVARLSGASPGARRLGLAVGGAWLLALGGLCWQQVGLWQHPVKLWSRALVLDPDNEIVLHQLGQGWMWANRPDRAEQAFRLALELEPRPQTLLALGDAVARQGRTDEALAMWAQLDDDEQPEAAFRAGIVLAEQGLHADAVQRLQDAIAAGYRAPAAYEALAKSLDALDRAAEAETWRKRAFEETGTAAPQRSD